MMREFKQALIVVPLAAAAAALLASLWPGYPAAQSGTTPANQVWAGPTSGGAGFAGPRPLVGADLPVPGASSLGGIESLTCASHQWLNTISTAGVPACAQPAFTDISGTALIAQGGTGAATQQAALNALMPAGVNPGDLVFWNGTNWVDFNGNTSGTKILQETSAGVLSWVVAGTGTVTNVATDASLSGGPCTSTCTLQLSAARQTLPTVSIATSSSHSGGFSANGSGTYTAPAGTLWYEVYMVAGGNGGGTDGTGGNGGGGGGGAGSFCYAIVKTNIGTGQAYTAGAATAASSFGTSFSFTTNAGGAGSNSSGVSGGQGGAGGAAGSGCTLNLTGGPGNTGGVGISGTASGTGGNGGASYFGPGGLGISGGTGTAGVNPGSGGGAGAAAGAAGQIYIVEHYGS